VAAVDVCLGDRSAGVLHAVPVVSAQLNAVELWNVPARMNSLLASQQRA
jgi:hypothetical protein